MCLFIGESEPSELSATKQQGVWSPKGETVPSRRCERSVSEVNGAILIAQAEKTTRCVECEGGKR